MRPDHGGAAPVGHDRDLATVVDVVGPPVLYALATDLNILKYSDGHRTDLNNQYAIGAMPDPGYIGYHDCVYWVSLSRTRCDHGHIRYKNNDLANTTYEWALACHETGHSVGLRHQGTLSQSTVRCMYNPVPSTDPYVGTHNVAHINGLY